MQIAKRTNWNQRGLFAPDIWGEILISSLCAAWFPPGVTDGFLLIAALGQFCATGRNQVKPTPGNPEPAQTKTLPGTKTKPWELSQLKHWKSHTNSAIQIFKHVIKLNTAGNCDSTWRTFSFSNFAKHENMKSPIGNKYVSKAQCIPMGHLGLVQQDLQLQFKNKSICFGTTPVATIHNDTSRRINTVRNALLCSTCIEHQGRCFI